MQLYTMNVATGETSSIDVSDNQSQSDIEAALNALSTGKEDTFLFSPKPFIEGKLPSVSDLEIDKPQLISSLDDLSSNLPAPRAPKPTSPTDYPPKTSEERIVSTNPVTGLYVLVDKFNQYWPIANLPFNAHLTPPFATPTYIQLSTYWERIGIATVTGPQTYTYSESFTTGMSTTDATTLSAELGVSVPHLSAKISQTTSYSVTTSQERTVTDTYQIPVAAGQTCVYVLWQLMAKMRFLDSNLNPIHWTGSVNFMTKLNAWFPNEIRTSMTKTIYSDRTDFPS
jgi:hypothetical protein